MKRLCASIIVLLFIQFFFALPTFAQDSTFNICEGWDCQACDLVSLAETMIDFLILISSIVGALLFMYAGFLYVTASGSREKISSAHSIFTNVAIGFIIMLSAWLIVDTVMRLLVKDSFLGGPWNKIQCVAQPSVRAPETSEPGTPTVAGGPSTAAPTAQCPGCVTMSAEGLSCKPGVNCTVDAEFAKNLGTLTKDFPLTVTEGYPPKATHKNRCHYNGTCLDVVFPDRDFSSVEKIKAFQEAAQKAGYRAVYEPNIGTACPSGIDCTANVARGTHFSLYKLK